MQRNWDWVLEALNLKQLNASCSASFRFEDFIEFPFALRKPGVGFPPSNKKNHHQIVTAPKVFSPSNRSPREPWTLKGGQEAFIYFNLKVSGAQYILHLHKAVKQDFPHCLLFRKLRKRLQALLVNLKMQQRGCRMKRT